MHASPAPSRPVAPDPTRGVHASHELGPARRSRPPFGVPPMRLNNVFSQFLLGLSVLLTGCGADSPQGGGPLDSGVFRPGDPSAIVSPVDGIGRLYINLALAKHSESVIATIVIGNGTVNTVLVPAINGSRYQLSKRKSADPVIPLPPILEPNLSAGDFVPLPPGHAIQASFEYPSKHFFQGEEYRVSFVPNLSPSADRVKTSDLVSDWVVVAPWQG